MFFHTLERLGVWYKVIPVCLAINSPCLWQYCHHLFTSHRGFVATLTVGLYFVYIFFFGGNIGVLLFISSFCYSGNAGTRLFMRVWLRFLCDIFFLRNVRTEDRCWLGSSFHFRKLITSSSYPDVVVTSLLECQLTCLRLH